MVGVVYWHFDSSTGRTLDPKGPRMINQTPAHPAQDPGEKIFGVLGRLAFLAFLAALLGYGGLFAYTMLSGFDAVNLHRATLIDDAFYYFEIAKNLAAGEFSTFDGGITRTNGYHPVWLLMITPFYWVFDLESALFGIKALEIMLIAGAVVLLAVAARLARLPWIVLFSVLPGLYCQQGMIVGMEAAAGAFFLGATLLAAVLFVRDAERWRWLLAGIAFLLPWVRLEYVAISLFVTGCLALMSGYGAAGGGHLAAFGAARLRAAGVPLLFSIAGILVYFLYNGMVFGGIVPVSGAVKLGMTAHWSAGEAMDWAGVVGRFVDAAGRDVAAVAELCVYTLAIWGVARFRGWSNEAVTLLAVLVTLLALGAENLVVKGQVALLYALRLEVYSFWYYVPGYLVAALMMPVRCYVGIFFLCTFMPSRWMQWRRPAVVVVCAVGMAAAFDSYRFSEPFRAVSEWRHSSSVKDWSSLAWQAAAFERMLPPDAVIGSWDAGAIGYFAKRPVVNLDGLVNSYDYQRMGPDNVDLWLLRGGVPEFGVTHLANVLPQDRRTKIGKVGDGTRLGFEYVGSRMFYGGAGYTLKLWPLGDSGLGGHSWRSITLPSLGVDGRRNGYRVWRHGRVVQVFVPECTLNGPAANVPEMLAFTWREGAASRVVQRLWARPHRTELGYCTTTVLLPHGAETATAIYVDATTVDHVVAGTWPLLRAESGYSVYAVQNWLIYVREAKSPKAECSADDGDLGIADRYHFLHVHPVVRRDLPEDRLAHGFANYDSALNVMRRRAGGRCLAAVELPGYAIDEVRTGELSGGGEPIWQGRIDGLALRPAALGEFIAGAEQTGQAGYTVYVNQDQRKLLYVEPLAGEGTPCAPAYVSLHVHPRRLGDLPHWQRNAGFANLDFDLGEVGFVSDGHCLAAVPLPDFEIDHLKIGKSGTGHWTWHAR